ncbi:hypothetical protein J6590_016983 [Homalodisca vitripennis]|nr:hypothetical protein J6590_016983 [Homalodisca vitripennis]
MRINLVLKDIIEVSNSVLLQRRKRCLGSFITDVVRRGVSAGSMSCRLGSPTRESHITRALCSHRNVPLPNQLRPSCYHCNYCYFLPLISDMSQAAKALVRAATGTAAAVLTVPRLTAQPTL